MNAIQEKVQEFKGILYTYNKVTKELNYKVCDITVKCTLLGMLYYQDGMQLLDGTSIGNVKTMTPDQLGIILLEEDPQRYMNFVQRSFKDALDTSATLMYK